MSLYKEFSTLFPYLQSVRKIQEYLSFDVSFPNSWKLPKKFVDETKVIEQESKTPNQRMFSFVSEIDEISVGKTSDNIQNIIKYNIEREEKEKLFEQKVAELKIIFEKQSLSELKNLSFEFKKTKVKLEDNEDEIKAVGLVQ
jgi:cysteinyl-tRNA synthetase